MGLSAKSGNSVGARSLAWIGHRVPNPAVEGSNPSAPGGELAHPGVASATLSGRSDARGRPRRRPARGVRRASPRERSAGSAEVRRTGPSSNTMTFCTRCGKDAPGTAGFCPTCGSGRIDPAVGPPATEADAWPVVKITGVPAVARLGGPIDLPRLAEAVFGAHAPRVPSHVLRLSFPVPIGEGLPPRVEIDRRGRMRAFARRLRAPGGGRRYVALRSEAQARKAIAQAMRVLADARIPVDREPVVETGPIRANVYLGRGIEVRSLPERVPNSLYSTRAGSHPPKETPPEGTYNRAGSLIRLTSEEDLAGAVREITGGAWGAGGLPHVSFCRFGESPVLAQMSRGLDRAGEMLMTGYVQLLGSSTEAEVLAAVRSLGAMLDGAGLLGPLTPRDQLPPGVLEEDPAAFDYAAHDRGSPGGSRAEASLRFDHQG